MSKSVRPFGPRARDELAALSTARLWAGELPPAPPYVQPSPPGRAWDLDGQAVFVRHIAGPVDRPSTWYLHGLDGSSRNWDRLAAVLADATSGFAPDLPGTGGSDPPARDDFSIGTEVRLVAELIQRAGGEPVHLVGNSRGGVIAVFLAASMPHLVRSLTLISPAVPDFRLVGERGADPRLALVLIPGSTGPVVRRLSRLTPTDHARALAVTCFGEPDALNEEDLAAAQADFEARDKLPWTRSATVKSLRSLLYAQLRPGRWSFAAAARRIRVPTLVIWGTRDRLVDARLAKPTADLFAESRLLLLPRTGHVAQMERPHAVARAMLAMWEDV